MKVCGKYKWVVKDPPHQQFCFWLTTFEDIVGWVHDLLHPVDHRGKVSVKVFLPLVVTTGLIVAPKALALCTSGEPIRVDCRQKPQVQTLQDFGSPRAVRVP